MAPASLSPTTQRLRDYVRIPSVNPMGRSDLADAIVGERRLAEHLLEELRGLRVDARLVGRGERLSVVAEIAARDPLDTVIVASHIDTVPVDGMVIDPFDPIVEDGRVLGRGSCDTKGGMAALVSALEQVLERGVLRRNVIVVGEADEELSSVGVHDVLADLGSLREPAWVLATEPTELKVVHAHKGVAHVRLEATGRACHASDPGAGRNAIVALSHAVVALDALAARLAQHTQPGLGAGTLSIGQIRGGHAPNIVPDHAQLVADRRLLPGETVETARAEVEAALKDAGLEGVVRVTTCTLEKPTLGTPPSHACVGACREALRDAGQPDALDVVAFGTDAGVFEAAGLPGVVMGPGSIRMAHTSREHVEIDQLDAMTAFFVSLLSGR